MVRFLAAFGILAMVSAGPASADRWVFVNIPGQYKFGYEPSGSSSFEPIWFACRGGSAVMSAYYSDQPAAGNFGDVRLTGAGDDVRLYGDVPNEDFGMGYWLEAELGRSHAVFGMIASGQPLTYRSPGWTSQRLSSTGQAASAGRFWAACR